MSGRLQLRPAFSDRSGHVACDPKNNLYISTGVVPIKCWRTRGPSGLNSHRRRGQRLQGSMRQISITCATTVKLISLSRRSRMRSCSKGTSLGGPQISPSLTVTPPIQSYTNHARKCVRSRSGTHGKISQHNCKSKISHTSIILQARGLEGSNTSARS